MDNNFIGGEIEGVRESAERPKRTRKQTHTPQSTAIEPAYRTPANAPASSDGDREYVTVRYDSLEHGAVFSREIKANTYIVHTKDKATDDTFPPDYIVWVFRKKVAA